MDLGVRELVELRDDQYDPVDCRRIARRLCVLALQVSRRQTSVLLAADEPYGTARRVRPALSEPLFLHRVVRHASGRGAGTLPVQHPAGRVDFGRLYVGRSKGVGRDRVYRRVFFPEVLLQDLRAEYRCRHRGRRVLLFHVQLGRTAARKNTNRSGGETDCRNDDQDGVEFGDLAGAASPGRRCV
ncbi:UNVERIFIED_CONTAM: hypothetical protein GTU68_043442 [Idotea baltica]|nr:hypothetical protein [Idotea baltica]